MIRRERQLTTCAVQALFERAILQFLIERSGHEIPLNSRVP